MKKILVFIVAALVSYTGVYAQGTQEYTQRYKDIEYYDFDFQVEINNDGVASARWNSYLQNRGFMYYKLLYSTKYANPSYPELSAKYVGDDINNLSNSFYISSGEHHYFRICAITDEGYGVTGRYCSSSKKITGELSEDTQEYEEEHQDTDKKYQETIKTKDISAQLKDKVEDKVAGFITSLEAKNYNNDQIVEILDTIIEKLDIYKKQPRYEAIATYMQVVLERYRGDYEDALDIFDKIFSEY